MGIPWGYSTTRRPPGALPLGLAGSGPLATVALRTAQRRAAWPAVARYRRATLASPSMAGLTARFHDRTACAALWLCGARQGVHAGACTV